MKYEDKNKDNFIDAEEQTYDANSLMTFKQIILNHLNRIIIFGSKEMRGGYFDERINNQGMVIRTYVEDTREVYCNSVTALADCLLAHFDKEMIKAEDDLTKEYSAEEKSLTKQNEKGDITDQEANDKVRNVYLINKRKLFRELNKFLKRKNYLDIGDLIE